MSRRGASASAGLRRPLELALSRPDTALAWGTILGCVLLWFARRPGQLLRPYVWAEEYLILGRWINEGWSVGFKPIIGYFMAPTSQLTVVAAEISFTHAATLMYLFATAVFVVTLCALVVPDSRWGSRRVRCLMALTMTLVPVNPEAFGVLLYSLWWATLWPFIVLGWKRPYYMVRVLLLAVGALSSPAGAAMALVAVMAFAVRRTRVELVSSVVMVAGVVLQLLALRTSERGSALGDAPLVDIGEQVLRTGAYYVLWGIRPVPLDMGFALTLGLVILVALVVTPLLVARPERIDAGLLVVAAALHMVLSAVSAPLLSDPQIAGSRYLFLPFIFLGWVLLLWCRHATPQHAATVALGVLLLAHTSLTSTFSRAPESTTATLSWSKEIRACAASDAETYHVPIYTDGSTGYWALPMSPETCRRLL